MPKQGGQSDWRSSNVTHDSGLKLLPKVDLHRHLEGSLRLQTLVEMARTYDLDMPKELELLRPHVQVTNDPPNMNTFLAKFETLRHFYRSPETIHRLAYEVVADAARDNVRYLELRFSPQALSRVRGFTLDEVTDWVIDAVKQASEEFGIHVALIITLVRHDPLEQAKQVAEMAFSRYGRGIHGLDLAGDELNYSALPFKPLFLEANRLGLKTTLHAGEWCGADAVWLAVNEMKVDRIGHGVRAIDDPNLMALLKERGTALEVCLTSNMQTASVDRLEKHPLKQFLQQNVPVTLNTDDPRISNVTLTDEFEIAQRHLGVSYSEMRRMVFTAIDSGFVCDEEKVELRSFFAQHWTPAPPDSADNKPKWWGRRRA